MYKHLAFIIALLSIFTICLGQWHIDENFTWKDFQTKNNSELVGIFGNFINRVAVLIHKYYDGVIPAGNENAEELSEISKAAKEINEYLSKYEFRNALSALMNLARFGNQYLQTEEPW